MLATLIAFHPLARADPTTIFSDGFESGDFSAWTSQFTDPGNTIEVIAAAAHSGSYGLHAINNGSADVATTKKVFANNYTTLYERVYVYMLNIPTEEDGYIRFFDLRHDSVQDFGCGLMRDVSGNYEWFIHYPSESGYEGYDNSLSAAFIPSSGTWYCLEIKAVVSDTVGEARLYVNGVEVITATGLDTGTNALNATEVGIGLIDNNQPTSDKSFDAGVWSGANYIEVYEDDVVVADSYIGPATSLVTFDQTGLSSDFTGSVVTIDGFNYTLAQLPVSFNWNTGTSHNFTYQSPLVASADTKEYVWNSTSGTLGETVQNDNIVAGSSGTIVGNYVTQYYVTFDQSDLDSSATGNIVTVNGTGYPYSTPLNAGWYDAGTVLNYSYTGPVPSSNSGEQFRLDSITGPSSPLTVTAQVSVLGNYVTQYQVTFNQTGVGSDFAGPIVTIDSASYGVGNLSSAVFWWDTGSLHNFTFASPLNVNSSVQYTWFSTNGLSSVQTGSLTVAGTGTVAGSYKTQYYITFAQSGVSSDFTGTVVTIDTVNYSVTDLPVSFWWDNGSSNSFIFASPLMVNASEQYTWSSTSGLSSLQDGSLTVTASGSLVGNYNVQNGITFDTAGLSSDFTGTVLIVDGTNYTVTQLPVFFAWTIGSNHTFAYQSPLLVIANSKQYVWTGTSGLSILQNDTITLTTFGSIIGQYKTQWWITVSSSHDSPTASSWVDSGSSFNTSVTSPTEIVTNSSQWVCTGYKLDNGSLTAGTSYNFTSVASSHTIEFDWKEQYYLTVNSQYDTPGGAGWYDNGSTAYANLTSGTVPGSTGTQHVFTSWSGDASGTNYAQSNAITMNGPKTATAGWKIQYALTLSANFGTTSPSLGIHWYDSGSTVPINASSSTAGAGERYVWNGWTGSGSGSYTGNTNSTVLAMNNPINETASWTNQYYMTFGQDGLDATATGTVVTVNGSAITPTGLPYSLWVNSSDSLVFSYSNVSSTASNMFFVVTSVSANSPITVTGSVTIVGSYTTELLTMELDGTKGWYWTEGTTVTSMAEGDLYGNGMVEIVTGGYYFDGTRDVAQLVVWNGSNRAVLGVATWYWFGNTFINSVAIRDVDGDGHMEIVTGGYYFDGTRNVAQLIVWDGSTLTAKQIKIWYWGSGTTINSIAIGNVYGNSSVEIVTGGYYFDGTRDVAQLIVSDGSTLTAKQVKIWYWTNNTIINSVAVGDVDADGHIEIVTGGYYFDGTRDVAQLIVWNGSNLALKESTGWYMFGNTIINSVAIGDVDRDGHVEIVTGAYYFDGLRDVSQLVVWNGSTLTAKLVTVWFGGSNTVINYVAIGDINGDGIPEIVTGGYYYDGVRNLAQLTIWTASYA